MTRTQLLATLLLIAMLITNRANASVLDCPIEHQIHQEFDNGAAWSMCWDTRKRENLVLSNVHYTQVQGTPYRVFSSLRLSQLHVTYDDDHVTYNDVTQFGLGGGYVRTLTDSDCPNGTLHFMGERAGLCSSLSQGRELYRTANSIVSSQSLTLFSTSQVGAYAYIVTWKFFADGSVQPSIGAAGALQRSSSDPLSHHGRQLADTPGKSWLSHTHNYYWRMDFDLGEDSNDDTVHELRFVTDSDGRRSMQREQLSTESARAIDPSTMTLWEVTDREINDGQTNNNDRSELAPGYRIEPVNFGHKLIDSSTPHTQYDFFVTRQNDCERFASENTQYHPDCSDDVLQFVNDEKLTNQDIVLWHRISFHHVPRNEDRSIMHSHWDGFVMEARNLNHSSTDLIGTPESTRLAILSADEVTQNKRASASGCVIHESGNSSLNLLTILLITALAGLGRGRITRRCTAVAPQY